MTATCFPYGFPRQFWIDFCPANWRDRPIVPRCVNSEPGTFNHECGRDATVIATHADGHECCYCDGCAAHGTEALRAIGFWRMGGLDAPAFRAELTPEGEQFVIPGCERNHARAKGQLDLFG